MAHNQYELLKQRRFLPFFLTQSQGAFHANVFRNAVLALMVSQTGLSPAQADQLREVHAVYVLRSGRMCVAGLNSGNVEATAVAMAAVLA
mgnify:CR=1 FL=1